MNRLRNVRHEWFANLRAEGMGLEEAYERAGYAPDRSHACRLASRPDVARRINELRVYVTPMVSARPTYVIRWLLGVAKSGHTLGTPAGLREARFAFVEAARLQAAMEEAMARDRDLIEKQLGHLDARARRRGPSREVEAAVDPGPEPEDAYATEDPKPFDPVPDRLQTEDEDPRLRHTVLSQNFFPERRPRGPDDEDEDGDPFR
jgi:hypothetical protein